MAPWVGRLERAAFDFEGGHYSFGANLEQHALHGLLFYREWKVVESTSTTARLEIALGPAGWPFGGLVRQLITVSAVAIEQTAEIIAGPQAMPVSLGWHPWFTRSASGDSALRVPSAETLETEPDLIPTGRRLPVDAITDLRDGPVLADRYLDHTYVDVAGPVVLDQPDLRIVVTASTEVETYVIHTPPSGICIEPQTSWPDAPVLASRGISGTGLVRLGPGETLRATTTWRWSAPPAD
jgi:aldose 1-epimerase